MYDGSFWVGKGDVYFYLFLRCLFFLHFQIEIPRGGFLVGLGLFGPKYVGAVSIKVVVAALKVGEVGNKALRNTTI